MRIGLGKVEATEIIFHVNRRLNVANLEVCVDLAGQYKFGNDFDDAMIQSISVDAAPGPVMRNFRESLPGKCEVWNANLEKRDAARANLSHDISHNV